MTFDPAHFESRLGSFRLGRPLHYAEALASTQESALDAAQAGAPEGAVFIAGRQTRGRGRHGHSWSSPAGAGLYLSLILRPTRLAAAQSLLLTLAFGLAAADAVRAASGVEPDIRWPNDLMLAGRKFAGLLLESSSDGGRIQHAVLGIGINVQARSFPPELDAIATALALHTPQAPRLEDLAAAVLGECERRYDAFTPAATKPLLSEFAARCPMVEGLEVTVGGSGPTPFVGRTAGLESSGFLRVRCPDGAIRIVVNGDVRPREAGPASPA